MENETITNQNKYRLGLFLLNALCGLFLRENSSSLIGCLFLAHFPPFLPNKLRNARKRKKIDAFSSYWIMKYWSSCQVLHPPPLKFENRPFFDVFWHAKHFCLQLRTGIRYQFKLNAVISRTTRPSNKIITILLWDVVFGPLGCPENEKRTIFCHISWKPHFKSMKEPSEDT